MNIATFLQLPFAKNFQLLAGENGRSREITGVNILDNPQAADWLTPGELIVTSGYFFKESSTAMEEFLVKFEQIGIAGICIKPQIYLTPLPQKLLELCNQLAIPLIEIPYGMAFSKIMHTVMMLLAESSSKESQMMLDFNSELLEYGLKGKGLDQFIEQLALKLNNPLMITHADWSVLAVSSDDFIPFLKEHRQQSFFQYEQLQTLPPNFNRLKHPANFVLADGQNGTILPVYFNDITFGYLIVLHKNQPLTKNDYFTLEHASILAALEISHQIEKERIQNKVQRDFYRELLFGHATLEELNAFDIEFNYDLPYQVFLISVQIGTDDGQNIVQKKYEEDYLLRQFFLTAKHYSSPFTSDFHLFKQAKTFIGLVGKEKQTIEQETYFFKNFFHYLLNHLPENSQIQLFIGEAQPLAMIKSSYQQAKQLLQANASAENQLYFARDFYFELFLKEQISPEAARDFYSHYLAPLLQADQESLIETLQAFLNNNLNLAATSRELYIHRNTLLYRLDKIENLLGYSINSSQHALHLLLAFKFYQSF